MEETNGFNGTDYAKKEINAETANVRDETANGTQTGNAELLRRYCSSGSGDLQRIAAVLEVYIYKCMIFIYI